MNENHIARHLPTIPPSVAARLAALPKPAADSFGWTDEDAAAAKAARAEVTVAAWRESLKDELHDATLAGVAGPTAAAVVAWWRNPTARTLVLTGGYGSGKTWIAAALGGMAAAAGTIAVLVTPEALTAAFDPRTGDERLATRIDRARFLVLDELGGTDLPGWLAERLRSVVDRHLGNGGRIVVTSNLDPAKWDAWEKANPRLASRLAQDATTLTVNRNDRRRSL